MPEPSARPPDCETVVRALWDYLDGELQGVEMDAIDAHLARCDGCRGHADFEGRLLDEIAGLRREHDDPEELRSRVLEVLRRARATG